MTDHQKNREEMSWRDGGRVIKTKKSKSRAEGERGRENAKE